MNKKSEEKHDSNVKKIVNATARLIQTSGIEKVTVRAICREADISIGKFYYYFGGSTLEDAVEAAKILASENIQLLSLTGGMCRYMRNGHKEPGYFGDMAAAVRKVTTVPILLTGGVKTLDDAEGLLEKGITDFVGVGRQLYAHADWMM